MISANIKPCEQGILRLSNNLFFAGIEFCLQDFLESFNNVNFFHKRQAFSSFLNLRFIGKKEGLVLLICQKK